ncbi:glycosyltransferase family 39 protein, partial [bacterium]|nr:glycosyltransferase family 39 protein [bacterium]
MAGTIKGTAITKTVNTRTYTIWLGFILLCAALLRYNQAFDKGLIYWDEGLFIMGARFLRWRSDVILFKYLHYLDSGISGPLPDFYIGLPVFLQKPVHVLLLTIWSLPGWNEIVSAISFSINCGLLTILLTAEIARRWLNPWTGLVAAAWLAVQPYHVHYSRLALHEMDSMALFLLTILIWDSMNRKNSVFRAILTGCLSVATLGASYRYLPYLMLGGLMELFISLKSKCRPMDLFRRWAGMLFGALIAFVFLDTCYNIVFSPDYLWSQPDSYLSVLKMKFFGGESSFDLKFPGFYFKMIKEFDGLAAGLVLLVGWLWLFFRRNPTKWMLLIFTTVPFVLFSLTTTRVPRTITVILPFFALAVACLLVEVSNILKRKSRLALVLFITMFAISAVSMAWNLREIWQLKSGYPDVIDWFEKKNVQTHLSTMPSIYAVYKGRGAVKPVPFTLEAIHKEVERTKIRYLTVDWQKFLRYSKGVLEIEKAVLPVFAAPHNPGVFFATLHENHLPGDIE